MSSSIVIVGLSADDKVPGAYGETKFGQGRISISSLPTRVLVVGHHSGSGTADDDTVYPVPGDDEADALFGAGYEVARMCYAAKRAAPECDLYAAGLPDPTTPTAASLTFTFGGSWSTGGQVTVRVDGVPYTIGVGATDSTTNAAANLEDAIDADARAAVSASASSAVTTATVKSTGVNGNLHLADVDLSQAPAGLTCAMAGGTAKATGVTPFSSGVGALDISDTLTAIDATQYDRIAISMIDTTNAQALATAVNTKAGPTVNILEHFVVAHNGTLAAATTLAQTDLNEYRGQLIWLENCETHPMEMAAGWAAYRSVIEGSDPSPFYDGVEMPWIRAQDYQADYPGHSDLKSALNNGVTPLKTVNGRVQMVRSITTHSLNGSTPDYRCLDTYDATVADWARVAITLYWTSEWKVANEYLGPDPGTDERQPPEGVGTPSRWNADVISNVLRPMEDEGWIQELDSNLPTSEYSSGRIMTAVQVVPRKHNHQLGVSVRQRAAA